MSELNYNHREFLALTGLALAVPAISAISAAETPAPARCLVYDDQGASRCRGEVRALSPVRPAYAPFHDADRRGGGRSAVHAALRYGLPNRDAFISTRFRPSVRLRG
jgi:hypothetical protein